MKIFIVFSDSPCGTEKVYFFFRFAMMLQIEYEQVEDRILLINDTIFCALPVSNTSKGYSNIEKMLKRVITKSEKIKACGTCGQTPSIHELPLIEGIVESQKFDYTQRVVDSNKFIVFFKLN